MMNFREKKHLQFVPIKSTDFTKIFQNYKLSINKLLILYNKNLIKY